jgi:hypothetical protein
MPVYLSKRLLLIKAGKVSSIYNERINEVPPQHLLYAGFYGLRDIHDPYEQQEPSKRKKRKARTDDRTCRRRKDSTDSGTCEKVNKRTKCGNKSEMEWNFVNTMIGEKVDVKDMIKKLENEVFSCFLKHQKEYQSDDDDNDNKEEEEEEDVNTSEHYKRNRQITSPEEKEILEKCYLQYFLNGNNLKKEKIDMDLLANTLGWTRNRIVR